MAVNTFNKVAVFEILGILELASFAFNKVAHGQSFAELIG